MQLVGYQNRYVDSIYQALVDDDRLVISLTGPKGCGKSTIVDELADRLKEDWKVFVISGTGDSSPPYYTWYSTAHSAPLFGKTLISEISFGVNFQPVGLPLGFDFSIGLAKGEAILNSNEQAIIKGIHREAGNKKHVLIVAEEFRTWDSASKELLYKITSLNNETLGNDLSIHIVFVDEEPAVIDADRTGVTPFYISIAGLSLDDIQDVLLQQPFIKALELHDLSSVIRFTGYDLRLINMAVHYQQETPYTSTIKSLTELLETRISRMSAEQKAVCKTLEHVSIINNLFSEKEAAYLLGQEPVHAEKILNEAVSLNLIRKRQAYDFPNKQIQQYFEKKLDIEKKYLHYRFAQYLRKHYPEDYLGRAYHLCMSENANSDKNTLEAAYLLAIEIVRRNEVTGGAPEFMLEQRLAEIFSFLPKPITSIVRSNIQSYINGFNHISKYEYRDAIGQLSGMHLMYAPIAFLTDVQRLLLLCYVQLADDLAEIKNLADKLLASITQHAFIEDEIWCRTALLLLEVYGDRHVHPEHFHKLKREFEDKCRQHMFQGAFQALNARYACKAALFYNSMIAIKYTEESCEYYRTNNSTPYLYFSLCNNAANRIICGEYDVAIERLNECKQILKDNPAVQFPSTYKIENNILIASFLKSEGAIFDYSARKRDSIIPAAVSTASALSDLCGTQGYEVSHVIECNLFSMLMLAGNKTAAKAIVKRLETEYKHLDAYYRYYFHNAKLVTDILEGQYEDAANHLNQLEGQEVILLLGFSKVLNKRNQLLAQLIREKYSGDAFELNYEFAKRGFRVQDASTSYWGRGLLLSDLQFLSM